MVGLDTPKHHVPNYYCDRRPFGFGRMAFPRHKLTIPLLAIRIVGKNNHGCRRRHYLDHFIFFPKQIDMKLSYSSALLFVLLAAAQPDHAAAFLGNHHPYERRVSNIHQPQAPVPALQYANGDQTEEEGLVELAFVSNQRDIGTDEDKRTTTAPKHRNAIVQMASFVVHRLGCVLGMNPNDNDINTEFDFDELHMEVERFSAWVTPILDQAKEDAARGFALANERTPTKLGQEKPEAETPLQQLQQQEQQPWGLSKDKVPFHSQVVTNVKTNEARPVPYFATHVPLVETTDDKMETTVPASNEKSSKNVADWTDLAGNVFRNAMSHPNVALVGSFLESTASMAFQSASDMARDYAAKVFVKDHHLDPYQQQGTVRHYTPQPPCTPPKESLLLLDEDVDVDVDRVLEQVNEALELAKASPTNHALPNEPTKNVIGSGMNFSEIDDVLLQVESALELANASLN